ncbi:MAG TPA: glycosyl hydrolase 53 family protein [Abditibacteriaceae bacterium]|jgi:arabinogalactan endo-1,4-beta-galactosidase
MTSLFSSSAFWCDVRVLVAGLGVAVTLCGLTGAASAQPQEAASSANAMIVGADVSVLTSVEQAGGVFSQNGKKEDVLQLLKRNGFNYARLRVFHTPSGKGSLVCDMNYVLPLARRIKDAGLKLLIDFHYSDTWADPGKQFKPAAWEKLNFEQLQGAVFEYTRDAVAQLKRAGAAPDMIQIGNEINTGMLWEDGRANKDDAGWKRFAQLVKAGRDGARAALGSDSKVLFMHHVAEPKHIIWHFDNLLKHDSGFDVIGVSYYPFWHGDLNEFKQHMNAIAAKYNKPIIIAETAYAWTDQYFDEYPDVYHGKPAPGMPAYDKVGQAEYFRRFIAALQAIPNGHGAGFFYWEPAWLPSKSFGSPVDNTTLFDQNGAALPALEVIHKETR